MNGMIDAAALEKIVKAYDIRGRVPDELDATIAKRVGRAAALELGHSKFIVGRDQRASSPSIALGFIDGVLSQDVDVIDVGCVPTEVVAFASGKMNLPSAMVTASHLPAAYNGLKFTRAGAGGFGYEDGLRKLKDRILQADDNAAGNTGTYSSVDLTELFAAETLCRVPTPGNQELKIAVDGAHGVAGVTVPRILSDYGVDVIPVRLEPRPDFAGADPNPLDASNLKELAAVVIRRNCDFGLAFDGDADRVFAVDERGRPVRAEEFAAALLTAVLQGQVNASIVASKATSRAVSDIARDLGAEVHLCPVGHSRMKKCMSSRKAVLGVEHSGHYYFGSLFGIDSAALAALWFIVGLRRAAIPVSSWVEGFRRYHSSNEVTVQVSDPKRSLLQVVEAARGWSASVRLSDDSVEIEAALWWAVVRQSHTEPVVRVLVEGKSIDDVARSLKMIVRSATEGK